MDAYGLRIPALPDDGVTSAEADGWPTLELRQERAEAPDRTDLRADERRATLLLDRVATLTVTRTPLVAVVAAPSELSVDNLVHPVLVAVGAIAARWFDRSAFHAGAVLIGGRAWVLLGTPGSGKTTLTALMRQRGYAVLADDLAVVEDRHVLAGPRVGDLRAEAASALGEGVEVPDAVGRPRHRIDLGPAPSRAPLGGFVELTWGDEVSLEPLPLVDRLSLLVSHEALSLNPTGHRGFLDLLSLPCWRLSRPRRWDRVTDVVDTLAQLGDAAR